jgi:hypothetical protein
MLHEGEFSALELNLGKGQTQNSMHDADVLPVLIKKST